eukprot:TRINITY_DN8774_c0_g1_i1.p1 TRINITY_DN8774_c0_g1~~TRINITY_DN8774_c0_g1_i1.p1  ORF type:complete len:644 (+),score=118.31 TRINITY_DN8774_c0_g1_i1:68-1999(+)
MELMQWRKAIQNTRLATERNLTSGIDLGHIGTPMSSYSVRDERECSGRGSRTDVGGGADVIVDSTLAYRLDSCVTHITTLQKDFDTYRCVRDREIAKQQAAFEDFECHIKSESKQMEHELREKCSRLELQVLEAQAKAMKSQHPNHHELVTKAEHDKLQTRLSAMEDYIRRLSIEPPLKHANVVQMVYDEVDSRFQEIKQETASVARKSTSQELRCKLDFITNNLDEQIKSIVSSVKSETSATLSEFKSQQDHNVDSVVQNAAASVSQLKSNVDSLMLWKDITTSRLNDMDHEKATQSIKLSQEFHTIMDSTKSILEKQVSAAEQRILSSVDSQTEAYLRSQSEKIEQASKDLSTLKSTVECQNDHVTDLREKQTAASAEINSTIKSLQKSIGAQLEEIQSQPQPGSPRVSSEALQAIRSEQDRDRLQFQEEILKSRDLINQMDKTLTETLLTVRSELDDVIRKSRNTASSKPPLPAPRAGDDSDQGGWSSGYDTAVHGAPSDMSSHERELRSIADALRTKQTLHNVSTVSGGVLDTVSQPPQLNLSFGSTPVDGPQPSPLISPSLAATRNVIQQFNAAREECQLPSIQLSPCSSNTSEGTSVVSTTLTPIRSGSSSPDLTSAPTSFEPTSTFLDSIDQSSIT